jgi:hypothetical protein
VAHVADAPATAVVGQAGPYGGFRVILDDPAEDPGLRFDHYAAALAGMITQSRPEFAIGIFGGWGSGKTTLMRAIKRRLTDDPNVVTAWFTAWRYEKDPHLILPLLDTLRSELEARAKTDSRWPREAAALIGRAGQAFLAGVTVTGGTPLIGAGLDLGKVMEAAEKQKMHPLSFYHAGFVDLSEAISKLSGGGDRRVVIFVDDLDRCQPANALEVLDSMKLFFDVEGCVFVVGLDQEIAEKAVARKYQMPDHDTEPTLDGAQYIEKLFQVHFNLPRLGIQMLPGYLDYIKGHCGLTGVQRADIDAHVRRHFRYLRDEGSINPRQVKRLINTYTMQLLMLSPALGERLDPDVVLGLLCMSIRDGWQPFYNQLAAEPILFQRVLREAIEMADGSVKVSGENLICPPRLREYLLGTARPVLEVADLASYISAAESVWHPDAWVIDARVLVIRLRRSADSLPLDGSATDDDIQPIRDEIKSLADAVFPKRRAFGVLREAHDDLTCLLRELDAGVASLPGGDGETASAWLTGWTAKVDRIDVLLRDYQQYTSIARI